MTLKHSLLVAGNRVLRPIGVEIGRIAEPGNGSDRQRRECEEWLAQLPLGEAISSRHEGQTIEDVRRLRERYETPVFGTVDTWEVLMMLGACVDPTDQVLGAASQLVHVLQMLEAMIDDGVTDEGMLVAAIVHDIGKVLLLTDEDPANVVCMNRIIDGEPGGGLEQATTQWNHDEFAYSRLVDLLPRDLALLARYHSVMPHHIEPFLDAQDREFSVRYHQPFFRYDQYSMSAIRRPRLQIEEFRPLVRRWLPARIEV